MVKEAEANAAADRAKRERIERRNQADSLVYQAERQLKEFGDKISASDKSRIEKLISDLKDAINRDDDDKIKSTMPELQQALYSIGTSVYQSAAAAGASSTGSTGSSGGGDNVIDAEFSEGDK